MLGGVISALLLWGIYLQIQKQLGKIGSDAIWNTGPVYLLWFCILLMPLNIALEGFKWRLLAGSAQQLGYRKALESVLAGIALSIVTPNRIGEYPGRILYLKKKNTFRLISVSILGIFAQMLALFLFGFIGLLYFNTHFPGTLQMVVLIFCTISTVALAILFWSFELWMPIIEKIKWLRRFNIYGQLLKRFTGKEQLTILMISMLRLSIYTAQYLILLSWMNIQLPLLEGFFMSGLFFWIIAVILALIGLSTLKLR